MDNIKEMRLFECTCSHCQKIVYNKHGLADLKLAGWKEVGKKIYCPECFEPYSNVTPQVGDKVGCLVDDDTSRRIIYGKVYCVCELVKSEPGAVYVDIGDGWQRKLVRGEYHLLQE